MTWNGLNLIRLISLTNDISRNPTFSQEFPSRKTLGAREENRIPCISNRFHLSSNLGENGTAIHEKAMILGYPAGGRLGLLCKDVHLSDGYPNVVSVTMKKGLRIMKSS